MPVTHQGTARISHSFISSLRTRRRRRKGRRTRAKPMEDGQIYNTFVGDCPVFAPNEFRDSPHKEEILVLLCICSV
jgi:hypothetical protein